MATFACGNFDGTRPTTGASYNIQAREEGDQFPIDWVATCTFSGQTSEFKGAA
jgi:hypothetical protein